MKPTRDQLTDWIKRIAGEDSRTAFKSLFEAFYAELLRFALFYVRQKETAEELVQDVFVKIWQRRHFLPGVRNVRSYLFTTTRNQCLNHLQKTGPRGGTPLDDLPADQVPLTAFDPQRALELSELQRQVEVAVAQLPPRCRLIFTLVREQGHSYRDVAELLHLSPRTVEVQMGIALRKLSDSLRGEAQPKKF